ncbi:MAG TPA: NAD(P)-dependent oxidoreductase, partial [Elusimicrobiales bacterium]|nr:NAD(P)-dependent oxidoreductase [Elusimicrobiales bacterium]
MKKVFITGAAGFIGGYVVKEFVGQGWHVIAMVHRNNSPELEALARSGSVTILRGDAADLNSLQKAALAAAEGGAPEAVVHCAGRASDVGRDIEFRRANFEPVKNLTELALELNLGRLVFISTTDVYGMRDFNHETEEQLPAADNTGNSYPAYKIAAEDWLRAHLPPERFAIIRPAAVWGKGDRTFAPRILAYLKNAPCIVHFGKWGGRNRWPLAHVRNVAAAAFLAATRPEA